MDKEKLEREFGETTLSWAGYRLLWSFNAQRVLFVKGARYDTKRSLVEKGLAEFDGDVLKITNRGMMFYNYCHYTNWYDMNNQ